MRCASPQQAPRWPQHTMACLFPSLLDRRRRLLQDIVKRGRDLQARKSARPPVQHRWAAGPIDSLADRAVLACRAGASPASLPACMYTSTPPTRLLLPLPPPPSPSVTRYKGGAAVIEELGDAEEEESDAGQAARLAALWQEEAQKQAVAAKRAAARLAQEREAERARIRCARTSGDGGDGAGRRACACSSASGSPPRPWRLN